MPKCSKIFPTGWTTENSSAFPWSVIDLREGRWDGASKVGKFWMSVFRYLLLATVKTMTADCGKVREGRGQDSAGLARERTHSWETTLNRLGRRRSCGIMKSRLLLARSTIPWNGWRGTMFKGGRKPLPSWAWAGVCQPWGLLMASHPHRKRHQYNGSSNTSTLRLATGSVHAVGDFSARQTRVGKEESLGTQLLGLRGKKKWHFSNTPYGNSGYYLIWKLCM